MHIKSIIAEDFINYKIPSMFIASSICDFKCCKEAGVDVSICQNSPLVSSKTYDIPNTVIYRLFHSNNISKAVVIGGLEPFLQFNEVNDLISTFKHYHEQCDFVIYTGYYPEEIQNELKILKDHSNRYGKILVKFGRYIPNSSSIYDELLGVTLASSNQFTRRII